VTSAPFAKAPECNKHNPLHIYGDDETRKHWESSGADLGDKSFWVILVHLW